MDTTNEGAQGATDTSAAAATGAAGSDAAAAASAAATAQGQSQAATTTAPAQTLFSNGQPGQVEPAKIPDKYVVKNADGTVNHEQTAIKQAQGYADLHKRLVAGEAPPKDPNEYAIEAKLPEGVNFDDLKKDPEMQGFLKRMHAKGINNAQLSEVFDYYYNEMAPKLGSETRRLSVEDATKQLRQVWADDATFNGNIGSAERAMRAYSDGKAADALGSFERLNQKFGTDADFAAFAASIGKEIKEDSSVVVRSEVTAPKPGDLHPLQVDMKSAYWTSTHPEHAAAVAAVAAYNQRMYGSK